MERLGNNWAFICEWQKFNKVNHSFCRDPSFIGVTFLALDGLFICETELDGLQSLKSI